MRITRISTSFDSVKPGRRFEFSPEFNVVIGANGAGKSYLLWLLCQAMNRWIAGRRMPLLSSSPESPTRVVVEGVGPDNRPLLAEDRRPPGARPQWRRERYDVAFSGAGDRRALELQRSVLEGSARRAPVLFRARAESARTLPSRSLALHDPGSPLAGWNGALDVEYGPQSNSWFERPVGRFGPEHVVASARPAIRAVVSDVSDLRWNADSGSLDVEYLGARVAWAQLPGSVRAVSGLVGNLAWRASLLRGSPGEDVSTSASGVVLVEEIERDLHPNWQRRIVPDLRVAFPGLQFFVTTNSPFIVQSVEPDEVVNLDRNTSLDYPRSSIEDIAEVAMGVDDVQRSFVFKKKIELARRYLHLLERAPNEADGELQALKEQLDLMLAKFGTDPVWVAALLQKRAARGIDETS